MKKFLQFFTMMSVFLASTLLWAQPNDKKTLKKSQQTLTKERLLKPVHRYLNCLRGHPCPFEKIMVNDALKTSKESLPNLIKKFKILKVKLIEKLSPQYHPRYKRFLKRMMSRLQEGQYDISQLPRLGLESSVVKVAPNVALAFVSVLFQKTNKKVKTELFFLVLWKQKGQWFIAYMDDFPARWMVKHHPKNISTKH